uniref:Protein kinase domain-containing protein n=1 Tax=Plectus sambesii TaxID=2011161 RepID=A0A914VA45_9BILA
MAPEVIQGQRYGRKADVWSLGCSLVEMITGHPPWKDLEPMAAIFRIAFEVPQYQLPRDVDDELVKLLNALFTRQPEKRPHAREALEHAALQGF